MWVAGGEVDITSYLRYLVEWRRVRGTRAFEPELRDGGDAVSGWNGETWVMT